MDITKKPLLVCLNCQKSFHTLRKVTEADCPFCGSTALEESTTKFSEPIPYKCIISESMKGKALADVERIKRQQSLLELKGPEEASTINIQSGIAPRRALSESKEYNNKMRRKGLKRSA